jgi:hypothetical protein
MSKATPAAVAILRQATALKPKRKKISDGLLPSVAHQKQNPNSDHNTGLAVDLTHDPVNGIDCADIYNRFKSDGRVKYLIFQGKIWSKDKGEKKYTGTNQHNKHLHISIKDESANDTSPWFGWLNQPKPIYALFASMTIAPIKKAYPVLPCTCCKLHPNK